MKHPITILSCLAICFAASSCCESAYKKTDDGVIVRLEKKNENQTKTVRIRVLGDKIIRVSATPEKDFPEDASLAVLPLPEYSDYDVTSDDEAVTVSTASLEVRVDRADGRVSFFKGDGSPILAENRGGRNFAPITVEGKSAYTVTQTFESPDDSEGIYGLGQHQSEEFNYKGKNEELFQYNTKVSVPFVVSTGNYGILWDSYSFCRYGNPTDYMRLSEAFTLYDKDGRKGALTGTYIASDGSRMQRREESVDFDHLKRGDLNHVEGLPEDFNYQGSKITYEGYIEPSEAGIYDFILYYSGYQKVYVDGELVVPERWRTAWNPNSYKFRVALDSGRRIPLRMEWEPDGSVAYCGLKAYMPVDEDVREEMCWWGEMQEMIDYYFIAGDDMDDVIHGYRTITGKAPVMPKWAMGYWQSREKYNTQEEVLSTLAEFRRRRIPIDNIVIDWLHWPEDSWGSHEFDPARFPDPAGMVDSIHRMNGRVMVSVWPKFYVTTEHYKEFDSRGWMYRQAVTDSIRDWVGPGYLGSFYDAYAPEARKLFWKQIQDHYYPLGIDAWWMDASEPNVRDCVDMDYRKALCGPTALGPSTQYFNAYALVNAEAIYDGQRGADPDRRVFLLTRSGFAGQQRYSTATWSGDIATRWEDMRAQITAGLNFSVSGIPYWTMDIGGFCVEGRYVEAQNLFNRTGIENADLKEWRELNTRWYQFGAFVPLYRAHGQWPFREIYNIAPEGHPAYESILYYTRMRYDLMPYIYSLAGRTYFEDYTIMRPLVMDFAEDGTVRGLGDQYMFGPAFMAAPVTAYGARTREVYFPEGSLWYDFYTGKCAEGGAWAQVDAPYGRMPLFVRGGSIIPFGPEMQWSTEKEADVINLYVYAGRDGSFVLYEDENLNYNYEKGQCSFIAFEWNDASSTLVIRERKGGFPGMLQSRKFNIVKVDPEHPRTFDRNFTGKAVEYDGQEISVAVK